MVGFWGRRIMILFGPEERAVNLSLMVGGDKTETFIFQLEVAFKTNHAVNQGSLHNKKIIYIFQSFS